MRFRKNAPEFSLIRNHIKTIETRAATTRYRNIHRGDIITFLCAGKKFFRRVRQVYYYKTLRAMMRGLNIKKVFPDNNGTYKDVEKQYFAFPSYRQKIKKYGIVAFVFK